ncbi:MAG: efflux RND transporter periplasmic adaptor subunit [Flavobacteriales bacterium]
MRALIIALLLQVLFGCDSKSPEQGKPAMTDMPGMDMPDTSPTTASADRGLHLSDQQILLGNIHVDTVALHPMGLDVLLNGTLAVDQDRISMISTRVMGRVDQLFVKSLGERVEKGQPLYAIYSEDLNATVNELLLARDKSQQLTTGIIDLGQLVQTARNKLLFYGLTIAQVDELAKAEKAPVLITVLSPVSGIVTELSLREGDRVMEGGGIMTIAALNTLWVEAQAYPMDRKRIRQGMPAEVRVPARPGLTLSGTINFLNPALDASTIIDPVRIVVANTDGELRPGMQAYVRIILQQDTVLAVPTNAVLWDGQGATVWVRTGHNVFKSVMVKTGMEADDLTEIVSGLQRGDAVVISGAYLLNSEYKFKSGTDPMSGMKM